METVVSCLVNFFCCAVFIVLYLFGNRVLSLEISANMVVLFLINVLSFRRIHEAFKNISNNGADKKVTKKVLDASENHLSEKYFSMRLADNKAETKYEQPDFYEDINVDASEFADSSEYHAVNQPNTGDYDELQIF